MRYLEIVTLRIFFFSFDAINNDWADASCVSGIGVPSFLHTHWPSLVRGEGLLFVFRRRRRPAEEARREVDGHGEDDGGIVLGRDAVQRLEIAELQQG